MIFLRKKLNIKQRNMKKLLLLLFIAGFGLMGKAQPWSGNLPPEKKDYSFYDYQKAFNDYWSKYQVEKGWYLDENGNKQKAYGWKQFKRWEWNWEQRIDKQTGEFPKSTATAEYDKIYGNKKLAITSSNWVSLGPDWSASGYAGIGRVNTVAFHPSDINKFWIGAPAGGLWYTDDGGNSWTVLTDSNEVLGVSAIVIPTDFATSNTIYIGTGDRDASDNYSMGVLKSTDGGANWQTTGLSFNMASGESINRMLLLPNNNNTIFAATSDGVYKTTDGADNWTNLTSTEFIDIEFCPGSPDTIYGSTRQGKIYLTTNAGSTWNQVFNSGSNARIELAVSADDPSIVYALASNSSNGLLGIYKSNDFGATYTLKFNSLNLLGWDGYGGDNGGQGWYDLSMAADPNNADIAFVGGVNTWKTTDGGTNWEISNHWWGQNSQAVHADKHFLAYRNNESVLFECNDGGIYSTADGTTWADHTNGITISQIYRLSVAQTDPNYTMTGLQDNGSKFYNGTEWFDVIGGDGMECIIDYTDKNVQYGSLYYGDIERTTNQWNSSVNITNNIPGGANGAWVTPYCLDPIDHNTIYVGMTQLWKSTNQGNSFASIGNFGSQLRSLAIAPSNTDYIYAASSSTIWKTTDGGANWETITNGLPTSSASITYIAVKFNDPNTLWISMSGYNSYGVFESTNGGDTWTNISSGLPQIPVNCVIQNKLETEQTNLYAGTDYGVFIKQGENDWIPYNNNLPKTVVNELDIYYDMANPLNSRLKAATYGRGLWESPMELSGNYPPLLTTTEATDITINSATLNAEIINDFGSGITESGILYGLTSELEIGLPGVTQLSTNPTVTSGTFSLSVSDLLSGTTYYFRSYAINENGTGYGNTNDFVTLCASIANFPYTQDFETSELLPNCYSQEYVSGDNVNWIIGTGNNSSSPSNAHSGSNNLLFKDSDNTEDKTKLILPEFDLTSLTNPYLSFWLAKSGLYNIYTDELTVYYKTSNTGEWVELAAFTEIISEWTSENLYLPNASSTYYIAFEGNAIGGQGVCLDDVIVQEFDIVNNINNSEFSIYPNPTDESITLRLKDLNLPITFVLFDINGKEMMNTPINKELTNIDVSKIKSGIYYIRLNSSEKTYHQKLLIK